MDKTWLPSDKRPLSAKTIVDSDNAFRYSLETSKSVASPGPEGAVSNPPLRMDSTALLTLPAKKEIPRIVPELRFDDSTAPKGDPQKMINMRI